MSNGNTWRIRGPLLQAAEMLSTSDQQALVCVLIGQPGGLPVLACQPFGKTGAAHYVAGAAAKRLTKGLRVEVEGMGLKLDHHRGQQVLRLVSVDHITALEVPQHFTERQPVEA